MTPMRWTEAMSVGLPELDDDHKGLVDLINRLGDASREGHRSEPLRQALMQLMRYTEAHFGREQKVLSVCGYPELPHHIEEHGAFVEKIQEVARRFDADPEGTAEEIRRDLVEFLRDWLNHHIMIEDMAYRPYVDKKPAEASKAAQAFRGAEIWWSR